MRYQYNRLLDVHHMLPGFEDDQYHMHECLLSLTFMVDGACFVSKFKDMSELISMEDVHNTLSEVFLFPQKPDSYLERDVKIWCFGPEPPKQGVSRDAVFIGTDCAIFENILDYFRTMCASALSDKFNARIQIYRASMQVDFDGLSSMEYIHEAAPVYKI